MLLEPQVVHVYSQRKKKMATRGKKRVEQIIEEINEVQDSIRIIDQGPRLDVENDDEPTDPLSLINPDQPLDGNNYLAWSKAIKIFLQAKGKTGFINGTAEMPLTSNGLLEWQRADSMVRSWLMNSIDKDLQDSFLYCALASELWEELEEQFGVANGTQIYQLQRLVNTIERGNDIATVYFNELHKFWDELGSVRPMPCC